MAGTGTVVVTGATGKQGGAVANALIGRGLRVRALTRSPDGAAAKGLAKAGATIVAGDFSDPQALVAAMAGADTLYLMGTPYEAGTEAEVGHGLSAIRAARQAGVGHVVYGSVASAGERTGIPHFDSKAIVERRLAESGLNWSVVAPVAFMDFLGPQFLDGLRAGELRMALPADRKLQYVAPGDIGATVATLVERRESAFGERVEIAGDELTGDEVAAVLSRASGRDIVYVPVPVEAVRAFSTDLAAMFEWFDRVGYSVDRAALAKAFPDIRWTGVADWAEKQDWKVLSAAA